jgi:hypothetical protein
MNDRRVAERRHRFRKNCRRRQARQRQEEREKSNRRSSHGSFSHITEEAATVVRELHCGARTPARDAGDGRSCHPPMSNVSLKRQLIAMRFIMSYGKLYKLLAVLIPIVSLTTACSSDVTAPSTTPTTPAAPAAGTFAGRALQAATSTPIVSASVTMFVADVPVTTTTDASGAFSFSGLTAGASSLVVSAAGFIPSTSTVTVPQSGYVVMLAPVGAPTTPTLVSVTVTGNAVLTAGQTSQLAAATVRSDGVVTDVTSVAKWTSSMPDVAQVSSSGLVTAFAPGQTNITAAFREVSGTLTISVNVQ